MSSLRPLPARPNLEYERKEARRLLRRLHAADAEAVARGQLRLPPGHRVSPADYRLSDAQLILAREYGFTSWPRLVRYFTDLHRQLQSLQPTESSLESARDGFVRSLQVELADRRSWAARSVAAYVPRFYGRPLEAVFRGEVTEEEARLAAARRLGAPSWAALIERSSAAGVEPPSLEEGLGRRAHRAMADGGLPALLELAAANPSLVDPMDSDGRRLLSIALMVERARGPDRARPVIDWLTGHGFNLSLELCRQLCGTRQMTAETVRWLLDRGADPDWVAPNGVSVLEHALVRYWNGAAVDALAARAERKDEFWIAAGLGDVAGMRRFLGRGNRLTAAARIGRPPLDLAGQPQLPLHPDPDDEERLMEVFVVAMVNGRTEAMRVLAAAGFDVNTRIWDSPALNVAVGNRWVAVVETLMACGADPDLVGWRPNQSARELVREMVERQPDEKLLRIAELLRGTSRRV